MTSENNVHNQLSQCQSVGPNIDFNLLASNQDPNDDLQTQVSTNGPEISSRHYSPLLSGEVECLRSTPEKPADKPIIYFSGGTRAKNAPYIHHIAQTYGHAAFSMNYKSRMTNSDPRFIVNGDLNASLDDTRRYVPLSEAKGTSPDTTVVSRHQLHKAGTLLGIMDKENITDAIGIGVSESALHVLLAAYAEPERFRAIILGWPSGLLEQAPPRATLRNIGKYGMAAAWRIFNKGTRFEQHTHVADKRSLHPQGQAPINLTDARSVAVSQHCALLRKLATKKNAPKIGLITGMDDWIYPAEELFDPVFDTIYVTAGGHGIGYRHSTMQEVMAMVPRLEKHKAESGTIQTRKTAETAIDDWLILSPDIPEKRAKLLRQAAFRVFAA